MALTLAFDVYGTLIDTQGITAVLTDLLGAADAPRFAKALRTKQLEYSFRRGLMRYYTTFADCTRHALQYTCDALQLHLTEAQQELVLERYGQLPPFPEVASALTRLQGTGLRLFAFSNGRREDVRSLLAQAGLLDFMQEVVSVEEVRSFKPDPAVYAHFLRTAQVNTGSPAWLVSSNSFDVMGALAAGLGAAWVRRDPAEPSDPFGLTPTTVVPDLDALASQLVS